MASLSTCHLGLWLGWQIFLNLVKGVDLFKNNLPFDIMLCCIFELVPYCCPGESSRSGCSRHGRRLLPDGITVQRGAETAPTTLHPDWRTPSVSRCGGTVLPAPWDWGSRDFTGVLPQCTDIPTNRRRCGAADESGSEAST